MGVSKESISKFLIGNRFHVKLPILSPYGKYILEIGFTDFKSFLQLVVKHDRSVEITRRYSHRPHASTNAESIKFLLCCFGSRSRTGCCVTNRIRFAKSRSDFICGQDIFVQWRTQKIFMGGGFIQWHRVVICIWCGLFVTSQFDVTVLFPNQRFSKVR